MKHFNAVSMSDANEWNGWPLLDTGISQEDNKVWGILVQGLKADEVPEQLCDAKECAECIAELLELHYPIYKFNFVAFLAERGFDSKHGITDSTTTNHSNGKILIAVSSDNARAYNYSSSMPIFNGATPKTPNEAAALLRLLGV